MEVTYVQPMTGDPSDYVVLVTPAGRFALTPTCAANAVGVVPDTAFAKADRETARRGFAMLGAAMGMDGDALATAVLDLACAKVVTQVRALVEEYRLQPSSVDLIGGGGGAASLVPHAGRPDGRALAARAAGRGHLADRRGARDGPRHDRAEHRRPHAGRRAPRAAGGRRGRRTQRRAGRDRRGARRGRHAPQPGAGSGCRDRGTASRRGVRSRDGRGWPPIGGGALDAA